MILIKCDRCGHINTRMVIYQIIKHIGYNNGILVEPQHIFDICPDCYEELINGVIKK